MKTLNERDSLFYITYGVTLISFMVSKSLFLLLLAGLILFVFCFLVLKERKLSKGLPLNSRYNRYNNSLEFHIACTDDIRIIFKSLIELIAIGKERNQKVVFLTWHIKEDNLKRIFRHFVTIKKPHWFTYYTNLSSAVFYSDVPRWLLLPKKLRKKYKNIKYILVEIDPNNITSEYSHLRQIRHLFS